MTHLPPASSASTLRERFIADMTVRGFTDKTRNDYIRIVASGHMTFITGAGSDILALGQGTNTVIGYLALGATAGNLFFQLVNARYERGAMILTSNRGFSE